MNLIPASLKTEFQHFADGTDQAPERTYESPKAVRQVIGDAVDDLIRKMRALGLRADNCDGAFELEAAIYGWLKAANPDATLFPMTEGFGAALAGPARERVLADARHAAALVAHGDLEAADAAEEFARQDTAGYPFRLDGGEYADHGGQCIIGPDGNGWMAEIVTPVGGGAFATRIVQALNATDSRSRQ